MDWVQYPNHDIRGLIVLIEVGLEFLFPLFSQIDQPFGLALQCLF